VVDYDRIDSPRRAAPSCAGFGRESSWCSRTRRQPEPADEVGELLAEGLIVHKLAATRAQRRDRVVELLESVGLDAADVGVPALVLGGQRQRIAIARALSVGPGCSSATSRCPRWTSSVQAQVLNLLLDMNDRGLTILFVAHDLAVVRNVCSRVR